MKEYLICLAVAMIGGLLMSRLAKKLSLPAVTAYLVAGLLLGPFCIGRLDILGLGFSSLDAVKGFDIVSQAALGFIAFTIGNEFRLTQLKSMGRRAITVGILQAVITTAVVDVALIVLHFIKPDLLSVSSALPWAPSRRPPHPPQPLMVVRQYKADGR